MQINTNSDAQIKIICYCTLIYIWGFFCYFFLLSLLVLEQSDNKIDNYQNAIQHSNSAGFEIYPESPNSILPKSYVPSPNTLIV